MAGLEWFTVCADFPAHPKTVRLCRRIGDVNAGMYVVRLWSFCVEYQQDGLFVGDDAGAMLEHATGWAGEPGKMLDALLHCGTAGGVGFVEQRYGGFYVHEWVERNGAHIAKRHRDAERMREKREEERHQRDLLSGVARPSHDGSAGEREGEREEEKKKQKKTSSAPQAATEPALVVFPCSGVGPKEYAVTSSQLAEWSEAYPGLDVMAEVRKAHAWISVHPKKTSRGMPRFLVGWLNRAQNSNRNPLPKVDEYEQRMRRLRAEAEREPPEPRESEGRVDREADAGAEPAGHVPAASADLQAAIGKLLGPGWETGQLQDGPPVEHRPERR